MFKIGLTGGIGTGKSTVCNILAKLIDIRISDSDIIARNVVQKREVLSKIKATFGKDFFMEDGSLNRKKMRSAIVNDANQRAKLEAITHPEIIKVMKGELKKAEEENQNIIMEVPLLFELKLSPLFDFVVLIAANKKDKINRINKRDGITKKEAAGLINIQMPVEEKKKYADFIIKNNSSPEDAAKQLHQIILQKLKQS